MTRSELKTALIALKYLLSDDPEHELDEIDEDLDVRATKTILIADHFVVKWGVDDYEIGRL